MISESHECSSDPSVRPTELCDGLKATRNLGAFSLVLSALWMIATALNEFYKSDYYVMDGFSFCALIVLWTLGAMWLALKERERLSVEIGNFNLALWGGWVLLLTTSLQGCKQTETKSASLSYQLLSTENGSPCEVVLEKTAHAGYGATTDQHGYVPGEV